MPSTRAHQAILLIWPLVAKRIASYTFRLSTAVLMRSPSRVIETGALVRLLPRIRRGTPGSPIQHRIWDKRYGEIEASAPHAYSQRLYGLFVQHRQDFWPLPCSRAHDGRYAASYVRLYGNSRGRAISSNCGTYRRPLELRPCTVLWRIVESPCHTAQHTRRRHDNER